MDLGSMASDSRLRSRLTCSPFLNWVGLAMMLTYGITGVRQMAGSPEMLEKRRNGELDFGPCMPEVLACQVRSYRGQCAHA